jgi:hypothetical protein
MAIHMFLFLTSMTGIRTHFEPKHYTSQQIVKMWEEERRCLKRRDHKYEQERIPKPQKKE